MAYDVKPDQSQVRKAKPGDWKTEEEKAANTDADKVRLILNAISKSRDESKPWETECRDAWREFQAENNDGVYRKLVPWTCNSYPRYWSDTMVMLPALYNSQPTVVARRRFDNDPISRTGSIILERFATYLIDACPFNSAMSMCALEYLNSSKATCRVFYKCEYVKRKVRVPLYEVMGEEGPILLDKNNNPLPEGAIVDTDEAGAPYFEKEGEEEEIENPYIHVEPLHFDELLISSGARRPSDVWARAYKVTITRKYAAELFGADDIKNLISDTQNSSTEDLTAEDSNLKPSKELFTYWEFWDGRERKVYYVHEMLKTKFLTNKLNPDNEDPYGLRDFFPSPQEMMTNQRYSDLYPVPDYTQTRDLYENLHVSVKRMNRTVKSIKACAIYDGSSNELEEFFSEITDGQAIKMGNFKDLMKNGGLEQLIQIPDYSKLAMVLQQQMQTFQQQKQDLDEIRGISDIIRGTSEPTTSATAERIKKSMASNKFSLRQKEVARFVRDTVEMMCDLGLKEELFTDEQIKEIVGFRYLDADDQANFDAAMKMLRDDKSRLISIDIETDSIISMNEQEDIEAASQMSSAISQYMKEFIPAIQADPTMAPLLIKIIQLTLSKFRQGKQVQGEMDQFFKDLQDAAKNPPPPPPPPPDYEAMKIESNERIQMEKLRLEYTKRGDAVQKDMVEAQKGAAEFQASRADAVTKQNIEAAKITQDANEASINANLWGAEIASNERIAQLNASIDQMRLMIEDLATKAGIQIDTSALQLKARDIGAKESKIMGEQGLRNAELGLKAKKSSMEEQQHALEIQETFMEEARLRDQQMLDAKTSEDEIQKAIIEARTSTLEAVAAAPKGDSPVTINVQAPPPVEEIPIGGGAKIVVPK